MSYESMGLFSSVLGSRDHFRNDSRETSEVRVLTLGAVMAPADPYGI